MESITFAFIVPFVAVILDSLFGDPHNLPHPVRFIGQALDVFESSARRVGLGLRVAGWAAMILLSAAVWGIVEYLIAIPYLGVLIAIYLAYAGLALGCLVRDSRRVATLLDTGDLPGARKALSMLVSRDTESLDPNGIRRTLAETVSENLNDGFVAPMFYLAIFGPGGLWAYKVVSTMDSMWGYKTERFKDLGYAAAKTDDLLAFIPARITASLLLCVGKRFGLNVGLAKENYKADAGKMESPNAGWPMAAAAWLFEAQMGGQAVYFGKLTEKPVLGPKGRIWDKKKIRQLINLSKSAGHLAAWIFILTLGWLQIIL
ncbi:adenosylcobinamide-phosphate synthase CbiB [uncultured Pseudodesulfovibrio sp.]|uniref:adenosylcobinamide-phosphate synthase CbiB n=1 Tax=uncultured Pseudodesulfovibrio sp. TaxID=2035858 RepID=UPI0029C89FE1|nr:adenosylcobinamide-phosphate synthase CbiB [uncultured Pseudodesulfovibrio sp.]